MKNEREYKLYTLLKARIPQRWEDVKIFCWLAFIGRKGYIENSLKYMREYGRRFHWLLHIRVSSDSCKIKLTPSDC
ncbi:MAG: hypothetical protein C4549_03675 [Deltaproteobacteria bacterium]|nr:MAG: hypothetical protein C4549_03675 [Deltaproteobacteria bacterium]